MPTPIIPTSTIAMSIDSTTSSIANHWREFFYNMQLNETSLMRNKIKML